MGRADVLVPRASLCFWLARCVAAPLAPPIRDFMQARFDTDFTDVRIHTGRVAGWLCAALQARALTLGRDIVFADGAYAPDTAAGRRLLAHELAHVLQQRAVADPTAWRTSTGATDPFISVGDSRDQWEDEADRLAVEALDGGLRSCVTADRTGTIRRAISVLDATAGMTLSHNGATPAVSYVQRGATDYTRMAVLHLSRNSRPIVSGAIRGANQASAMRITGNVLVQADPKDDINAVKAAWSFRFVQLFYDLIEKASYAGRTKTDGSMLLDFAGPANYRGYGDFLVDSDPDDPGKIPFADTYTGLARVDPYSGMWRATVMIDDHPFADRPLVLMNFAAGQANNYLYEVARQFQLNTTLVAVDQKSGAIRPLVNVDWGALCVARLPWSVNRSGQTEVGPARITASYFSVGAARLGVHTGRGVAAKVTKPTRDPDWLYNKASKDALAAVLMATASNQDVEASAGWRASVPPDHFKTMP